MNDKISIVKKLEICGKAAFGDRWQTDISKALNVSDRTIRRWISGKSGVPVGTCADLHKLLIQKKAEIDSAIAALGVSGIDREINISECRGDGDRIITGKVKYFNTIVETALGFYINGVGPDSWRSGNVALTFINPESGHTVELAGLTVPVRSASMSDADYIEVVKAEFINALERCEVSCQAHRDEEEEIIW